MSKPAFFVCAVLALQLPAFAQPAPAPTRAAFNAAFDIDIQAPDEVREHLERHIELQRYRGLSDLDALELERLMAAARQNVLDLMGTLGYFSPRIELGLAQAGVSLSPAGGASPRTVQIHVTPGEAARVASVKLRFAGDLADDPAGQARRDALQAAWPLRPGMRFTQAAWDQAKQTVLSALTGQRYPAGRITSSLADIDPDTATAHLSVELDSAAAYRLGELRVEGLQRYDPALVRRMARLQPGEEYSEARLLQAQQRLGDSRYFDSVLVSLDTGAGQAQAAPVLVQVREAKLQKLVLGVGASTDGGARLSVEHTHHRVPGIDWQAVTSLSLDRETRSIETELTSLPDAANWRWVTSARFQQQSAGSYAVDSERYRLGRTQSGDRFDRNYYLQYDRSRSNDASTQIDADALTINYAWTQRSFDNLPFPSDGHGLGVEVGGGTTLGADRTPFFRTQARWLAVWPVGSTAGPGSPAASRIATRVQAGAVLARSGVALPATQLFLTGGDTTVRGYSARSIGTELATGGIAAGRYMATGSIEWQRPIRIGGQRSDWETTLFMDAGAVADEPAALTPKVGIGAGARWRSPVGPLQMDLAYGLALRQFRLHLNVGFTF